MTNRFPTFLDEVAFVSNPFDTPQVYTSLTGRARSRSFRRGRQTERTATDTGTSKVEFENSDRALDPANAASTYYPNVIPMRRNRCRVANAVPGDGGSMVVSGNEITDIVRAAVVQGDSRTAPDSSFGIWQSATNLAYKAAAGDPVQLTTVDASCTRTDLGGGWFRITNPTGGTLNVMRFLTLLADLVNAEKYTSSFLYRNKTGGVTIDWCDVTTYTLGSGVNGVEVDLGGGVKRVQTTQARATYDGTFRFLDLTLAAGVSIDIKWLQIEHNPLATPYVASATTRAMARVQAPTSLLDKTQGWVAARVRMGFPSTNADLVNQYVAELTVDASNRVALNYSGAGVFNTQNVSGGGVTGTASKTQAFATGDSLTVVFAWTAATLYISINGSAFIAVSRGALPIGSPTTIDIGGARGIDGRALYGDILWFAAGIGTLSNADAATIAAYGTEAPDASALLWPVNAAMTMVWKADTVTYRTPSDAYLFTNFIDTERGWELDQPGPGECYASAPANDGFDILATYKFGGSDSFLANSAGNRIIAVLDAIGWPAAERDIDTTSLTSTVSAEVVGTLSGVSALDLCQNAAANDNGVFFIDGRGYAVFKGRHRQADPRFTNVQATFADKANWIPGYFLYESAPPSSSRILNDFHVTPRGGTEQQWDDDDNGGTSIATYRRRTDTVSTFHVTDAEALNYAQYRVSLEKAPHRRYDELVIRPMDDAELWVAVLSLGIGDRVRVIQSPPGGGAPDVHDLLIEAVSASIGPGVEAAFTYRLSPALDQVGWILGDAVYGLLGQTTVLTY